MRFSWGDGELCSRKSSVRLTEVGGLRVGWIMGALFSRLTAKRKKLFRRRVVLILMEGRGWNSYWPGWVASATILAARLLLPLHVINHISFQFVSPSVCLSLLVNLQVSRCYSCVFPTSGCWSNHPALYFVCFLFFLPLTPTCQAAHPEPGSAGAFFHRKYEIFLSIVARDGI